MPGLFEQLRRCFEGGVCLLGVGNPDCGDDALGVRLAEALTEARSHMVAAVREGEGVAAEDRRVPKLIVAGGTPERFIGRLIDAGFDHVIFLDAVEFGGDPGAVVFLDSKQMAARFPQVSTHKISLGLLARCLEANGRTRAWLLGVQPESLQSGAGLTPAVQNTLKILTELLGKMAAANPAVAHSALSERRTLLGAPIEAPRSAIA
jgi:hydrogenase 3 maturation protease